MWLRTPRAVATLRRVSAAGYASHQSPVVAAVAQRWLSASVESRSFQEWRIAQWENEKLRQQRQPSQGLAEAKRITVTLQIDGKPHAFEGIAGATTAIDILRQMQEQGLPKVVHQALAVQLDSGKRVLDLRHPFDSDCAIEFLDFSSDAGKKVFWHSSAHVLGQVLETKFQDKIRLTDGPALSEGGFFYEMFLDDNLTVSESDFAELSGHIKKIVKQKQPFERLEVSRDFAKELFQYSEFKLQMLDKIPRDEAVTLYRCGPLIDLCRGPHVPHTGLLSSFAITRCGASHWEDRDLLQRVYGISFPSNALLSEWQHLQDEAKKRDHRLIGRQQQLFLFHPLSPGSSFFLPHGTRVFNTLANFIRDEYRRRGYDEVITPLIFKKELWEISGHLANYRNDMFMVSPGITTASATCADHTHAQLHALAHAHDETDADADHFGLKPMNCPGHCILFRESKTYSYRDLPVRLADFSALHRNEASGALTGLTRVRRFHQDDAHIFCMASQVQHEIAECLAFVQHVYGVFGFTFELRLSTRPEKFMGDLAVWDSAEQQLREALDEFNQPWTVNEGDGAFYGPKIDIVVMDALKRRHQCGTIQLDFQLPLNFELKYDGADGKSDHTPIIIHRAVLGSIERMMAILIEHTGGKWPLWLSPRQVAIVPVAEAHRAYAAEVASTLSQEGRLFVDVQDSSKTLNKRVREAQLAGYNYILVVGDKEVEQRLVNVRTRDNQVHGATPVATFLKDALEAIQRFE